jgi:hypothetical protein
MTMSPIAAKVPSRYMMAGASATSKQYPIRGLIAYTRDPDVAFRVCHDNGFCKEHFNARNLYTNADGNAVYHVPGSRTIIVYYQTGDGRRQHDTRALTLLRHNIPAAGPSDVACREHLPEGATHRALRYGTGKPNKLGCEGNISKYNKWCNGSCLGSLRIGANCVLTKDARVEFRVCPWNSLNESGELESTEAWMRYNVPNTATIVVHH